jgi:hypothetical protein
MVRTSRSSTWRTGERSRAASSSSAMPRPCIETRQDLVTAIRERYRAGTKDEKLRILDEFVAVTGYHRKHAIRLFKAGSAARGATRRSRVPVYDAAVREALVVLWEASDRVCGKRLRPLLPILVSALERHGHLTLASTVRARVLSASAATLDRVLRPTRAAISGRRTRRRAIHAVRRNVPVRTFADWEDPVPGDMEADLVSHGGESTAGSFVHTLTLTDVASGWTECVALVVRDGALVAAALEQTAHQHAVPLRGFDTDNGGEFMNETVAAYCRLHGIPCTRSRPYYKNDQAWVEQKNGSVVRRLVGYRRLEGLAAAAALSQLYAAARLFVNFFQPSFKLASKTRVGAKVRKTYHAPETPYAKLLAARVRYREPEQLRHTFASTLLSRNAPLLYVQGQGGWRSGSVLLRVYARWMPPQAFAEGAHEQPSATPAQLNPADAPALGA